MKAGKHVIIEYPVCQHKKELTNLYNISQKQNRICAVAYYSRYHSQYKYVFDQAMAGNLGKINGLFISGKSADYFDSKDIVNNLIGQDIDFMVRLLGLPRQFLCENLHQHYAFFIFDYVDFYVMIEGSTRMHPGFPFTTKQTISGTKATLDLLWQFTDHPSSTMIHTNSEKQELVNVEDYDPYLFELNYIIKGIQNNKEVASFSIESLLESATLTFKCREKMGNTH